MCDMLRAVVVALVLLVGLCHSRSRSKTPSPTSSSSVSLSLPSQCISASQASIDALNGGLGVVVKAFTSGITRVTGGDVVVAILCGDTVTQLVADTMCVAQFGLPFYAVLTRASASDVSTYIQRYPQLGTIGFSSLTLDCPASTSMSAASVESALASLSSCNLCSSWRSSPTTVQPLTCTNNTIARIRCRAKLTSWTAAPDDPLAVAPRTSAVVDAAPYTAGSTGTAVVDSISPSLAQTFCTPNKIATLGKGWNTATNRPLPAALAGGQNGSFQYTLWCATPNASNCELEPVVNGSRSNDAVVVCSNPVVPSPLQIRPANNVTCGGITVAGDGNGLVATMCTNDQQTSLRSFQAQRVCATQALIESLALGLCKWNGYDTAKLVTTGLPAFSEVMLHLQCPPTPFVNSLLKKNFSACRMKFVSAYSAEFIAADCANVNISCAKVNMPQPAVDWIVGSALFGGVMAISTIVSCIQTNNHKNAVLSGAVRARSRTKFRTRSTLPLESHADPASVLGMYSVGVAADVKHPTSAPPVPQQETDHK